MACVCPLVGEAGPEAGEGSLVSRVRAQLVPGQMLACLCMDCVHRLQGYSCPEAFFCLMVGEAGPKAREGSLVGGPWILGLLPAHWYVELSPKVSGCRALGVLCLLPAHWCVEPGLRCSCGQDYVQERLWTQRISRQPICRWVGLCPCQVSCLA